MNIFKELQEAFAPCPFRFSYELTYTKEDFLNSWNKNLKIIELAIKRKIINLEIIENPEIPIKDIENIDRERILASLEGKKRPLTPEEDFLLRFKCHHSVDLAREVVQILWQRFSYLNILKDRNLIHKKLSNGEKVIYIDNETGYAVGCKSDVALIEQKRDKIKPIVIVEIGNVEPTKIILALFRPDIYIYPVAKEFWVYKDVNETRKLWIFKRGKKHHEFHKLIKEVSYGE